MAAYTLSQTQKDAYAHDGYVFVPGLVDDSQLSALQDACDRVVAKTRAGEWPHRRIVGKQFPPFDGSEPDSWGVQHITHPDLHEPIFVRWYGSERVVGAATSLLGCSEDQVQMELFNLLINPDRHAFALRWHRDDVPETVGPEEEIAALKTNFFGVQWNTALHDDACLFVVPGSHREPRTPDQRALSSTQEAPKDPMEMPGAICVKLKAGDTVFYQNNILHTAAYHPNVKRATLHASMGDIRGGNRRARMILQHQVDWVRGDGFLSTFKSEGPPNDGVATRLEGMRNRLLAMADSVHGQLEYSQQG
ncbi:phytanoyl-CoA dioxygenase [Rhizoctonia solani AG-3 Rhs1AP]|uniref:Phytanoyl-CoA dioxygenase n=1 Tax=Rhizoctonia solani AG-3 Rhs1AP TaxID=1086054 RepID=X8JID1_9AGAM|nr:phytanoyl-CoA dioxygenase [Rhizoctonia solani AG-3 Rhs1AP]